MNLAEQLGPGEGAVTSPLSVFFEGIITALLQFTERANNEANCRTSAYEAISTLAMCSADVSSRAAFQHMRLPAYSYCVCRTVSTLCKESC